uniref:HDC13249 n=1 Tax=Drosophila melanogaster TaxID=7227 RepID=Q6IK75_DROME|nr:TPA_inf: HDC13249 [Drosophila melanogaster]
MSSSRAGEPTGDSHNGDSDKLNEQGMHTANRIDGKCCENTLWLLQKAKGPEMVPATPSVREQVLATGIGIGEGVGPV